MTDRSTLGSELGPDAVARGEQYLTELIARVEPLGRGVDPAATRRYSECEAAIMALHRVGALDDRARARGRNQPPHRTAAGFVTEPAFHDQRTERIAEQAELQAREDAGEIRRVIVGPRDRHDRLAIVAIVVHADVTRVHFHYLAEPAESTTVWWPSPARKAVRRHRRAVQAGPKRARLPRHRRRV